MTLTMADEEILTDATRSITGAQSLRKVERKEIWDVAALGDVIVIVVSRQLDPSPYGWIRAADQPFVLWQMITRIGDPIPDALAYFIAKPENHRMSLGEMIILLSKSSGTVISYPKDGGTPARFHAGPTISRSQADQIIEELARLQDLER